MIKKIFILIPIIATLPASSMDIGRLYDITQQEIAKETVVRRAQIPADKVLLISNDEQEFLIPLEVAKQSQTIKNTIEDLAMNVIPLAPIAGPLLKEIVNLLTVLHENQNLKGKKLLDTLEEKVKIADPLELLRAANYLDIPIIMNLAARKIAQQEAGKYKIMQLITKKEPTLEEKLIQFGASRKDILKLIAHYYFLITGTKLKEVPANSYAFSVLDILEYRPTLVKIKDKTLDLDNLNINNLEGIDSIPGIEAATKLYLKNNLITNLAPSLFNLTNLEILDLSENQITQIPEEISHLINLYRLILSHNRITHLPDGLYNLNELRRLYLDHNRIEEISDKISQLTNLYLLQLSSNQITEIPTEIGQLSSLKLLYLQKNKIRQIPLAISNLHNLTYLDLGYNQLDNLDYDTLTALSALQNLSKLYLDNNLFSKSDINFALDFFEQTMPKDTYIQFWEKS